MLDWGPGGLFIARMVAFSIIAVGMTMLKLTTWPRMLIAWALILLANAYPSLNEYPIEWLAGASMFLVFLPFWVLAGGARPKFGWAARFIILGGATFTAWAGLLAVAGTIALLDEVVDMSQSDIIEPPLSFLVAPIDGLVGGVLLTLTLWFAIWRATVVSRRAGLAV